MRKKRRSIDWPVRALPLIAAAILFLTSCGTPQPSVTIRNLVDATAQPGVAAASTATQGSSTTAQQAASAQTMPGMAESTTAAQAPSAGTAGPAPTDFVAAWVLFGTPTPTTGSRSAVGAAASAVPATTVAQPTTAAQPTTTPTRLPATAAASTAATANSAASGAGSTTGSGDPAKGKIAFNTVGCTACHDVANGITIVGPSLKGVASRAGSRKPGMAAEDYLRESILKPNAFIVPGFQPGIMLQNFGQTLSTQQLNDVIAYLMTLK